MIQGLNHGKVIITQKKYKSIQIFQFIVTESIVTWLLFITTVNDNILSSSAFLLGLKSVFLLLPQQNKLLQLLKHRDICFLFTPRLLLSHPTQIVCPLINPLILTHRVFTLVNVHIYHLSFLWLVRLLVRLLIRLSLVHLVDWVVLGQLTRVFLIYWLMPWLTFLFLSWVVGFAPLSGMVLFLSTGNYLWLIIEELLNLLFMLGFRVFPCLWRVPFQLLNFTLLHRLHLLKLTHIESESLHGVLEFNNDGVLMIDGPFHDLILMTELFNLLAQFLDLLLGWCHLTKVRKCLFPWICISCRKLHSWLNDLFHITEAYLIQVSVTLMTSLSILVWWMSLCIVLYYFYL